MSLLYYTPDVSPGNCSNIADQVFSYLSQENFQTLNYICSIVDDWLVQDKFSAPMVWIGIYIAVASLICILAMASDLVHGFRHLKLWFPSKYFSLNAASITVITVTMKLPVDLSSQMPSYMDQAAKLGSLAFMCVMMVNLMPSLASMDNMTLVANVIGLSILVITIIVNVIIDISTGVIKHTKFNHLSSFSFVDCVLVAYIYIGMMLLLLVIMISSSLTISTSKEILESKYQAKNRTSSTDQSLQHSQMFTVEKLRRYVRRNWVMAETGSPQFVMAANPLTTASGVICVFVFAMNLLVVFEAPFGSHPEEDVYRSSYKWSILFILVTQSVGVLVGTIAPVFRCFTILSFNLVTKWDGNHLKVFKVEKYWTRKLYEWKRSHVAFPSSSRTSRNLIFNSKKYVLSICIIFQKSLEARLFPPPIDSGTNDVNAEVSNYVLQINDEMELAEHTLKDISDSMNFFISTAEKEQNKNLLKFLEKSTGFNGVEIFDNDHVQPLLSVEFVNSWSLPIITLTCIAVALPNICKDVVESLVKNVGEGLIYTHIVEESLNRESEYVNIRKVTMTLWHEIENNRNWLKNAIKVDTFKGKTAIQVLKWFAEKAEEESINHKMVNSFERLIAANSVYRISRTILLRDESNAEPICEQQLFDLLNGMIADIMSACFTNLPHVIRLKCHESVIEKREASVKVAAKLLGKTTKILQNLETRELPSMEPDKMMYIDGWRNYLKQSIP
ncbi:uncharacterized protein [Rutidosis leptorrhynchoides]|uniref:uncharacterized protein n=1 Tax=Rutidosis leptorrhynchoides TaxID=125765 RepID=UPI003A99F11F